MLSSYATDSAALKAGKVTPADLVRMKGRGEKIAMVTAYDAPSGRLADRAGVDCVLVGDSAAMTVFGRDATTSVTMEEMVLLTRAARAGVSRALLVADMPFGSFQVSDVAAVEHAIRFVKEAGADAVKLEGAGTSTRRIAAIVGAGVPAVGHLGLTPQSATLLGGFKAQARTAEQAERICQDAVALEDAGCCAIVLEAIPEPVARRISRAARVPTIGIGAGAVCDGQVLVWHDLLGLSEGHVARFVKRYAALGNEIVSVLQQYVSDVRASRFPDASHTYKMPESELELFETTSDDSHPLA